MGEKACRQTRRLVELPWAAPLLANGSSEGFVVAVLLAQLALQLLLRHCLVSILRAEVQDALEDMLVILHRLVCFPRNLVGPPLHFVVQETHLGQMWR